ncbi:hypothetical protein TWF718_007797 [Orbilia javanica]|uniref:Uncharacterized protein n=1 Tax=Orbilia javanica TaxID=47235 RepID=A0AAN8MPG6_9PEZI
MVNLHDDRDNRWQHLKAFTNLLRYLQKYVNGVVGVETMSVFYPVYPHYLQQAVPAALFS